MVFYSHPLPVSGKLPRYFDLAYYAENKGIPYTFSSNLLLALQAAIKRVQWDQRFAEIRHSASYLRPRLQELGFNLVGNESNCSPAVVTIVLPPELNSSEIGARLQEAGYLLSCNSDYLRKRNWIQVCTMSECSPGKLLALTNALVRTCGHTGHSAPAKASTPA